MAAGIFSLARHDPDLDGGDDALLYLWDLALKTRIRGETCELDIDRLEIQVEWQEQKKTWQAIRILSPRSIRLPKPGGEIIDWVDGLVTGAAQAEKPFREPAAGARSAPPADPRLTIGIFFALENIGQAEVQYSARASQIDNAGLADKVRVTIQISGSGDKWYVKRIHRSVPHPRIDNDQ